MNLAMSMGALVTGWKPFTLFLRPGMPFLRRLYAGFVTNARTRVERGQN
jgi:hypothetical protein